MNPFNNTTNRPPTPERKDGRGMCASWENISTRQRNNRVKEANERAELERRRERKRNSKRNERAQKKKNQTATIPTSTTNVVDPPSSASPPAATIHGQPDFVGPAMIPPTPTPAVASTISDTKPAASADDLKQLTGLVVKGQQTMNRQIQNVDGLSSCMKDLAMTSKAHGFVLNNHGVRLNTVEEVQQDQGARLQQQEIESEELRRTATMAQRSAAKARKYAAKSVKKMKGLVKTAEEVLSPFSKKKLFSSGSSPHSNRGSTSSSNVSSPLSSPSSAASSVGANGNAISPGDYPIVPSPTTNNNIDAVNVVGSVSGVHSGDARDADDDGASNDGIEWADAKAESGGEDEAIVPSPTTKNNTDAVNEVDSIHSGDPGDDGIEWADAKAECDGEDEVEESDGDEEAIPGPGFFGRIFGRG